MTKTILILWRFSRPHTIIGTSLSVLALYLITLSESNFNVLSAETFILALLSCLAGNIYIVGLNQIMDIDIDRVNKPALPLPSGELSVHSAKRIVLISGILSIGLSLTQGVYLFLVVFISLVLGTTYSLPPFRLKRYPFWASFSIFVVRGFVINLGLYLHFSTLLAHNVNIPPYIWALTFFMFGLSLVIAWYKDLPDLEGDRIFKIHTFAIRMGVQKVFSAGILLVSICYLGLIITGLFPIRGVNQGIFVFSHLIVLFIFLIKSMGVDPEQKQEIARFYQFIWKLFYFEYIIFPISCFFA